MRKIPNLALVSAIASAVITFYICAPEGQAGSNDIRVYMDSGNFTQFCWCALTVFVAVLIGSQV